MWQKVCLWGLNRVESSSQEEGHHEGDNCRYTSNGDFGRKGRMVVDEYYVAKAKRKSESNRFGQVISNSEFNAMSPQNESEEERMMRIAMEKSLQDWDKDHGYGKRNNRSPSPHNGGNSNHSRLSEENNSASSNRQRSSQRVKKQPHRGNNVLAAIGEDDNLIDFGVEDASRAISQIEITREKSSDISVLDDDDATTASFMLNTAWNSRDAQLQQLHEMSAPHQQPLTGHVYANPQWMPYHDPTFREQLVQQPLSSAGTLGRPSGSTGLPPSDASFAVPPPPTWDDYKDAFGGSVRDMGASIMGRSTISINPMSPASSASVDMISPMAQQDIMQQWQSQPKRLVPSGGISGVMAVGASTGDHPAQVGKVNKFDPLRADPFAS